MIALTEELLATAKQNDISGSNTGRSGRTSPNMLLSENNNMVNPYPFELFLCLVLGW